jgi:hypothetical protein
MRVSLTRRDVEIAAIAHLWERIAVLRKILFLANRISRCDLPNPTAQLRVFAYRKNKLVIQSYMH